MQDIIGRSNLIFEVSQSVTLFKDINLRLAHNILSHAILPRKGTLDQFTPSEARLL